MDKRPYPISVKFFEAEIKSLITQCYAAAGRPQKVSDYQVCGQEFPGEICRNVMDIGI